MNYVIKIKDKFKSFKMYINKGNFKNETSHVFRENNFKPVILLISFSTQLLQLVCAASFLYLSYAAPEVNFKWAKL